MCVCVLSFFLGGTSWWGLVMEGLQLSQLPAVHEEAVEPSRALAKKGVGAVLCFFLWWGRGGCRIHGFVVGQKRVQGFCLFGLKVYEALSITVSPEPVSYTHLRAHETLNQISL